MQLAQLRGRAAERRRVPTADPAGRRGTLSNGIGEQRQHARQHAQQRTQLHAQNIKHESDS